MARLYPRWVLLVSLVRYTTFAWGLHNLFSDLGDTGLFLFSFQSVPGFGYLGGAQQNLTEAHLGFKSAWVSILHVEGFL